MVVQIYDVYAMCYPSFRIVQRSPIISANDLIIQSEQAVFTPLQIHRIKG